MLLVRGLPLLLVWEETVPWLLVRGLLGLLWGLHGRVGVLPGRLAGACGSAWRAVCVQKGGKLHTGTTCDKTAVKSKPVSPPPYLFKQLIQSARRRHGGGRVVHANAVGGRVQQAVIGGVTHWACPCEERIVVQHWRQPQPLSHHLCGGGCMRL